MAAAASAAGSRRSTTGSIPPAWAIFARSATRRGAIPAAMTTTATGVRVAEVTGPGTPEFDAFVTVRQADDAELSPADPVTPPEELAAELFRTPPHVVQQAWVASRDGVPVGAAVREQDIDGVNDAAMALYVMTHPDHRRQGVALALARTGLDGLAAAGATSVIGWSADEA